MAASGRLEDAVVAVSDRTDSTKNDGVGRRVESGEYPQIGAQARALMAVFDLGYDPCTLCLRSLASESVLWGVPFECEGRRGTLQNPVLAGPVICMLQEYTLPNKH